jgi:hypothetical protein
MGAQRDEPLGLGARPFSTRVTAGLGVVVADPARHGAEVLERQHVPFQERLLRLGGERDVERPARARQRSTNSHSFSSVPAIMAWNSPESTSASAPGRCACGTLASALSRPSSVLRRATYRDTVTSDKAAPCSATAAARPA